jgi:hypothetical protein
VVGRSPEQFFINNSPQRKFRSKKGKRSAPQAKPLNAATAPFVPNASFHPGAASSGTKKTPHGYAAVARSTATAASGSKKGVCVDEYRNRVLEVTTGSDDDDENWEDLVPSDDGSDEHIGDVDAVDDAAAAPPPSEAAYDEGSEAESAAAASSGSDVKSSSAVSSDSSSEDEFDDEPPLIYADLGPFDGLIQYRDGKVKDFWFADYTNLSVKEWRELLKSRGQATSGAKTALGRRLELGDMRRLNELHTLNRLDKLQPHERHIKALISRHSTIKEDGIHCSKLSDPIGQSVFPGRSHSQPASS